MNTPRILTHDDIDSLRQELEDGGGDLGYAQVRYVLAALDLATLALNLRPPPAGEDLLDPRQRRAVAIILCSIDLPAEMGAWAALVGTAATLTPGLTTGDITMGSRDDGLRRARDLLDEMLGEKIA